jgi:hypothetical protein
MRAGAPERRGRKCGHAIETSAEAVDTLVTTLTLPVLESVANPDEGGVWLLWFESASPMFVGG